MHEAMGKNESSYICALCVCLNILRVEQRPRAREGTLRGREIVRLALHVLVRSDDRVTVYRITCCPPTSHSPAATPPRRPSRQGRLSID